MSHVEAIFEGGVFRPLGAVDLPEHERVVVSFEPKKKLSLTEWLDRARKRREYLKNKYGMFPDSTLFIREDRDR